MSDREELRALSSAYEELGLSPAEAAEAARRKLTPTPAAPQPERRAPGRRWGLAALACNLVLALALLEAVAPSLGLVGVGLALFASHLLTGLALGWGLRGEVRARALAAHHLGYLWAIGGGAVATALLTAFPLSAALPAFLLAGLGVLAVSLSARAGEALRGGSRGRRRLMGG